MELNINSPAYYNNIYGVDDDIYHMCRTLSSYMRDKSYSDVINSVGVCPIVAPQEELDKGLWKETKKCELKYGFASVSLQINYEKYIEANIDEKKSLIVKNVVNSIKAIKTRGKIDFKLFESDMIKFCEENNIKYIS